MKTYCLLVILAVLIPYRWAHSYVQTLTTQGNTVRWKAPFQFKLFGNPTNKSDFQSQDFYDAVIKSLQRWKYAARGAMSFEYQQGVNGKEFSSNSENNGISNIYFASQSQGSTSF